jgi:NADH-quinone oxidoreductase subunit D
MASASTPAVRELIAGDPTVWEDAESHPSVRELRATFGPKIGAAVIDTDGVPAVRVDRQCVAEVLGHLRDNPDQAYDFLADVMGVDPGGGRDIQVWYQLWSNEHGRRLRMVAECPLTSLTVESVAGLWKSADWLERETFDMFGITFTGHPDLRRILMPENYDEGFPLRKEFPLRGRFSRSEQTRRALGRSREDVYSRQELEMAGVLTTGDEVLDIPPDLDPVDVPEVVDRLPGEKMVLNLGPQHPATHGVLRLVVELDGETVVRCIPHIGYLHTGFEKTCEYREWNQVIPYTDRMDYLAPMMYNIGYALAVESLLGVEITPRCTVTRVILMELDRILGHLLWLGTSGIDLGALTVFLYTFEDRERIYNLHEAYCGGRITTSVTRIGGMVADLPVGWVDGCRDLVRTLPSTLDECESLLSNNGIWLARTLDVGPIDGATAIDYGLTGPCLRASGVPYDVRKARPYLGYEEYDFDVPVGEHGDTYDRYLVRLEEMRQSIRILEQALDRLPDGPMDIDDPLVVLPPKSESMASIDSMIAHFKLVMEGVRVPAGEVWYSVEASKGELGFGIVSDGGSKPVRCRFRGPSFVNVAALPYLVEGQLIADLISSNASLDIVLGEIDR